jgi:Ca2+-binding RTX toxin-like protein
MQQEERPVANYSVIQSPFIYQSPFVRHGTSGHDFLVSAYSGTANETFYGYEGDDYIDGRLGADTMYGGTGDDQYVVENAGDSVIEYAAQGYDWVYSSISYTLPANVEILHLEGSALNGTGNELSNTLYGNANSNVLRGGAGADYLDGRGNNDTLYGGTDADRYIVYSAGDTVVEYANEGIDTVYSLISYTLGANVENLRLIAGGNVGTGNNLNNDIEGNAAGNTLSGGGGSDYLRGQAGTDVLAGDAGADTLSGGAGADAFDWNLTADFGVTVATMDLIIDFNFADGDRIDLSGVDANAYVAGDQAFTFIGTAGFSGNPGEINYYHSGGETIIQIQTGTSVDIEGGIRLSGTLTPDASWFVL